MSLLSSLSSFIETSSMFDRNSVDDGNAEKTSPSLVVWEITDVLENQKEEIIRIQEQLKKKKNESKGAVGIENPMTTTTTTTLTAKLQQLLLLDSSVPTFEDRVKMFQFIMEAASSRLLLLTPTPAVPSPSSDNNSQQPQENNLNESMTKKDLHTEAKESNSNSSNDTNPVIEMKDLSLTSTPAFTSTTSTTTDIKEQPVLAKEQQKQKQIIILQRLHQLFEKEFLPCMMSCLFLSCNNEEDDNKVKKNFSSSRTISITSFTSILFEKQQDLSGKAEQHQQQEASFLRTPPQDAFRCVTLLLYNYMLSSSATTALSTATSGKTTNANSPMKKEYDARLRYVIKAACCQVLAMSLERDIEQMRNTQIQKLVESSGDKIREGKEDKEQTPRKQETDLTLSHVEAEEMVTNTIQNVIIDIANNEQEQQGLNIVVSNDNDNTIIAPTANTTLTPVPSLMDSSTYITTPSTMLKTLDEVYEQEFIESNTVSENENDKRHDETETKTETSGNNTIDNDTNNINNTTLPTKEKDDQKAENENTSTDKLLQQRVKYLAHEKFQIMEKTIANNILTGMQILQQVQVQSKIPNTNANETTNNTKEASHSLSSKESWIRAIKIGSVGAVAGTLFAVTGGLAAPGIAAGISAFGGMSLVGSSAAAAATAITATPHALMLFFGLGGGGLSAYKMKKRTDGLSEFRIRQEIPDEDTKQETNDNKQESNGSDDTTAQSPDIGQNRNELHSTICVAGWLGDKCDFQRPFGVNLTDPSPSNIEQLERFFSVYDPERIPECQQLLSFYEDQQAVLWEELKNQYGCDPDHLYPIVTHNNKNEDGTMRGLKEEEDQILEEIFHCILCSHSNADDLKSHIAKMKATKSKDLSESLVTTSAEQLGSTQSHSFPKRGYISSKKKESFGKDLYSLLSLNYHVVKVKSPQASSPLQQQYVWDYQGVYGGNLFTVTWESDMLLNVCDVVNNLVKEIANQATEKVLQKTALAALLSAVSWPSTILKMADMIDEEWSMVCLRADMAGVELAKSLLESTELQPVTFVGFSFGARVIYSCLLELARHQDIWEQQQHNQSSLGCNTTDNTFAPDKDKGSKTSSSDVLIYRREPASIVESVVLMGMPVHSDKKAWRLIRSVVAGHLINCFSRKDWILSLMFRWKSIRVWGNPCGITMIDLPGVENHDVSSLVTTHADYCFAVYSILEMVGFHQPA